MSIKKTKRGAVFAEIERMSPLGYCFRRLNRGDKSFRAIGEVLPELGLRSVSKKRVVLGSLVTTPFTLLLAEDSAFSFRINTKAKATTSVSKGSVNINPLFHRENHFHNSQYYNYHQPPIDQGDSESWMTPGHVVTLAPTKQNATVGNTVTRENSASQSRPVGGRNLSDKNNINTGSNRIGRVMDNLLIGRQDGNSPVYALTNNRHTIYSHPQKNNTSQTDLPSTHSPVCEHHARIKSANSIPLAPDSQYSGDAHTTNEQKYQLGSVGDSLYYDQVEGKKPRNDIGQDLRHGRHLTHRKPLTDTFGVLQRGTASLGVRQDGVENHRVSKEEFLGQNPRLTQKLFSTETSKEPFNSSRAIEEIKSRRGSSVGQDDAADADTNRTQQVVQVLEQKIQSLSKGQAAEIAALRKEIQRLITLIESKGMSDLIPKLKPLRFI